jgi:putative phosphoribosyl transferase
LWFSLFYIRKAFIQISGYYSLDVLDFNYPIFKESNRVKYTNRKHAGLVLANLLKTYEHRTDAIVLALPRGGVPVAYEISIALSLPLDVFIVRKLGVPGHEELAMGAVASGGIVVLNNNIISALHIDPSLIDSVQQEELDELARREHLYRGNRPAPDLLGKTIILVDDGIATGSTMKAALAALQQQNPTMILIAVPVASLAVVDEMALLVDTIVCPVRPIAFYAVGLWYDDFSQTTDEEVINLLEQSKQHLKETGKV